MIAELDIFQPPRLWAATSAAFVVTAAALAFAGAVDKRELAGENVWKKPLKFALSFPIHFGTLALVSHFLPAEVQAQPWLRLSAMGSATAAFFELAYIAFQAARQRRSHFNMDTRFERLMYGLMGLGAVLLMAPAPLIGLAVAVESRIHWAVSVRIGISVSFIAGTVLTTLTGLQMGARMSHFTSGRSALSRRMPWTGWSLDGADLRPSHFLAVHMTQAIPLAAYLCSRVMPEVAATALGTLGSIGWIWLTLISLRSALKAGHRSIPATRDHDDGLPDYHRDAR